MEIFYVFSIIGIENYPAAGEFFLENVILKVSQTHFSKDLYPKGGPMPPLGFAKGGGHGTLFIISQKYFSVFRSPHLPLDTPFWTRCFPLVMQSRKAGFPFATRARKREPCPQISNR